VSISFVIITFSIIPAMYFLSLVKLPILQVVARRPEPETPNPQQHTAKSSEVSRMRRGTQDFHRRVPDLVRECWRRMRIMHAAFERSQRAKDIAPSS
jgi:hypothetical protein